ESQLWDEFNGRITGEIRRVEKACDGRLGVMKSDIQTLTKTATKALEDNRHTLSEHIRRSETQLTAAGERIMTDVEARIAAAKKKAADDQDVFIKGAIKDLREAYTALDGRCTTALDGMNALTQRVDGSEEKLEKTRGDVGTVVEDMKKVMITIPLVKKMSTNAAKDVAKVRETVDRLEADVARVRAEAAAREAQSYLFLDDGDD
ncbi:MAG: hypothetical protein EB075_12635, partial [Bacteroidetes bacterium]|nr:hypothetical protein [Bacteroidota bacterium]